MISMTEQSMPSERQIRCASEALGISEDDARKNVRAIPEADAFYFWDSSRGGLAAYIGPDCSMLVAASCVNRSKHYEDFLAGRRN